MVRLCYVLLAVGVVFVLCSGRPAEAGDRFHCGFPRVESSCWGSRIANYRDARRARWSSLRARIHLQSHGYPGDSVTTGDPPVTVECETCYAAPTIE